MWYCYVEHKVNAHCNKHCMQMELDGTEKKRQAKEDVEEWCSGGYEALWI